MCFIDYKKAFDKVKHEKMTELLKNIGLDSRDICIIGNLYWNQKASVKVDDRMTEEIKIKRGVRQGCVLSPLLFNVYSEAIFKEALFDAVEGITVGGERINNIRYADDTVLLADNEEDMQAIINRVVEVSTIYGLEINTQKTKLMVISKQNLPEPRITIGSNQLGRVTSYKYLGCCLNDQWDCNKEVRSRIEQARSAFIKMKTVLSNRDLQAELRIRVLRCYIFSILLYGAESWTLTKATSKKLEAFEMWAYRRILRISWVDRITNVEVLQRLGKNTEILNTIKKRKLEYLGHIMRHERYRIMQLIMQGKIQGKRSIGRRKTSWLRNLREWYGKTTAELFRAAVSKVQIAIMITNLR